MEEAGGCLDALLTAVVWVIQWSSSLRSANNKAQGQTSGSILSLTELSQSLKYTSKCPALLQNLYECCEVCSSPVWTWPGASVPLHVLPLSCLQMGTQRYRRKKGGLFSLARGSEAMEAGRQRGVSPSTGKASPVT